MNQNNSMNYIARFNLYIRARVCVCVYKIKTKQQQIQ